jgi:hypothetical protein
VGKIVDSGAGKRYKILRHPGGGTMGFLCRAEL